MARVGIKNFYRKIRERIKGREVIVILSTVTSYQHATKLHVFGKGVKKVANVSQETILDRVGGTRFKKKCKVNWPELDMYCGCCSLTTGIYIRSAINLVVTALSIICNSEILTNVLETRPIIFGTNLTTNEYYLTLNITNFQEDLKGLRIIYNGIVAYYIVWLSYKVIYVLILLWTVFAIFKRNGIMLKILLCISVPNLILDIFISFLGALVIRLSMRMLLLLSILAEGYNILALNSEYKKITGKSKVRHKDIELEPETPAMPDFINSPHRDLRYVYNQVHCRGCNCTIDGPPDNGNEVVSIQPSANSIQTTLIAVKGIDENELNYAITGILNPRNIEESVRNDMARNASGQHAVRPNTLNLTVNVVKDEKVMVTDEPVIYDVNQLNVGTSPVIEDREK